MVLNLDLFLIIFKYLRGRNIIKFFLVSAGINQFCHRYINLILPYKNIGNRRELIKKLGRNNDIYHFKKYIPDIDFYDFLLFVANSNCEKLLIYLLDKIEKINIPELELYCKDKIVYYLLLNQNFDLFDKYFLNPQLLFIDKNSLFSLICKKNHKLFFKMIDIFDKMLIFLESKEKDGYYPYYDYFALYRIAMENADLELIYYLENKDKKLWNIYVEYMVLNFDTTLFSQFWQLNWRDANIKFIEFIIFRLNSIYDKYYYKLELLKTSIYCQSEVLFFYLIRELKNRNLPIDLNSIIIDVHYILNPNFKIISYILENIKFDYQTISDFIKCLSSFKLKLIKYIFSNYGNYILYDSKNKIVEYIIWHVHKDDYNKATKYLENIIPKENIHNYLDIFAENAVINHNVEFIKYLEEKYRYNPYNINILNLAIKTNFLTNVIKYLLDRMIIMGIDESEIDENAAYHKNVIYFLMDYKNYLRKQNKTK